MLNIHSFSRFFLGLLPTPLESSTLHQDEEWKRDPLSHPILQRMSLEQLADLPFDRGACHEPAAQSCSITES